MTYEYQCVNESCLVVIELIQVSSANRTETIPCPHCGGTAEFKISAPAISRVGMTNQPFDVAIGRDSESRWAVIRERQTTRDKVRQQSNQVGLAAVDFHTFKPISDEGRKKRTAAVKAAERTGYGTINEGER